MKKNPCTILSSKGGFTLVELIVSITILMIIITPFFSMFVQTAKTNSDSEGMIDATYVAQTHIEKLFNETLGDRVSVGNYLVRDVEKNGLGFTVITDGCNKDKKEGYDYSCFGKEVNANDTSKGFYVRIELKEKEGNPNQVSAIVKVYDDSSNEKVKAQMESILSWRN